MPRLVVPLIALWFQAGVAGPELARLDSLAQLAQTDQSARRQLVDAMRADDPAVADYAALQLSRAGASALPTLLASLRDPDARVRRLGAYAIGEQGPRARRALPELIALLAADEDSVAGMANWAIVKVAPRSNSPMLAALRDLRFGPGGDRGGAAVRMRSMSGSWFAIPALLRLMSDADPAVASAATATLSGYGWQVLAPAYDMLLHGSPLMRSRALLLVTQVRTGVF